MLEPMDIIIIISISICLLFGIVLFTSQYSGKSKSSISDKDVEEIVRRVNAMKDKIDKGN